MTWSADEILLAASEHAVEVLRGSTLAPYAYHLTDLEGYPWHRPEVRHGLPVGGLLVIRLAGELCEAASAWRWEELEQARPLLNVQVTAALAEYLPRDSHIPQQLRLAAAHLAAQVGQPILYYTCEMWGGDVEYENTLVYSPDEELLRTAVPEGGSPDAPDALRDGLSRIGLQLPTRYFAPHTRDFPWSEYRLQGKP